MGRALATRGRAPATTLTRPREVPGRVPPRAIRPFLPRTHIAYFSMELGVRPEIHTYAGGLGLLAGDMARECADLELPVIFVTMASRRGYVRQVIDRKGRQSERPDVWSPENQCQLLPMEVSVQIERRFIWIRPWLTVLTGHAGFQIPVVLLDTDIRRNSPDDRALTDTLYGGDAAYRFKQEIILGPGGLRMLRALGFDIHTYHMNEGHAALLTLDLLRGSPVESAGHGRRPSPYEVAGVRRRCVFTTHTPVKAGHDQFVYRLVKRLLPGEVDLAALKRLGGKDRLNLTRLGVNLSHYVNGVSVRHAETTRKMFPGHRVHAVTNGVHVGSWLHPAFARLFDTSLPGWRHRPELLVRVPQLPDRKIWDCHQVAKRSLLERIRRTKGISLDPQAPTLVFARRMTGYKRPSLLFADVGRLVEVASRHRFQLVFAGKAHPKDRAGKDAIRRIHRAMYELRDRVPSVFLPNYDIDWARTLVGGSDVWLQTPLPPMEACGTSGMKAGLNGGLNLSPLDGWWAEGCVEGVNGWSFAHSKGRSSDRRDAEALYNRLDEAVLPCFYDQPQRWRAMMKQSIAEVGSYFTSHRMLQQYAAEAYLGSD